VAGSTYRRIGIALLLACGLLMSPPAASGGLIWDLGIACGYACTVFLVCLFAFPVRGDGLSRDRLLAHSQHRLLGWLTALTAAAHVLVLIVRQTLITRYLLPSAPVFMWCGAVALILAVTLVKYAGRWHTAMAAAMALALWAHFLGSGQAIAGVLKTAAVGLLLALPVLWFGFRRRTAASRQKTIRYGAAIATIIVVPLLPSPTASRLLLAPVARPEFAPIVFPHDTHTSVNCVVCHHNFTDHTGVAGCIDCHRSQRTDLPQSSEATFHVFCRDCHSRLATGGARHGPTRECDACHRSGG
jgi:hypothetical protein